jgi:hypothetical protein
MRFSKVPLVSMDIMSIAMNALRRHCKNICMNKVFSKKKKCSPTYIIMRRLNKDFLEVF